MTYPKYRSTRSAEPVSFADALLQGLAPDGGLFVPTFIPKLDGIDFRKKDGSFSDLAIDVLTRWLGGELASESIRAAARDALDFPVPLIPLQGDGWDNVHVLELFHGPTLSFKDFGARTMARLMSTVLGSAGEKLTILVATSGDTGSAVADGFAGVPNVRVVLLYPDGLVSPTQERQLIVKRQGVQAVAVRGNFDDCQRLVKEAFADPGYDGVQLSSANSINIGRLLPQMLYYIHAVRQLGGAEVVISVPSGNLGNLTGGVMAALGGMPVRQFLASHNANDFFPRHLTDGSTEWLPSKRTYSNAMDVGVPSNFERLQHLLTADDLRRLIRGFSVSDDDTLASMRRVADECGYIADPHTAVGLEAVRRYRKSTGSPEPAIVLSTAHPAKFPEVTVQALGKKAPTPERLSRLWDEETNVISIEPSAGALREVVLARW